MKHKSKSLEMNAHNPRVGKAPLDRADSSVTKPCDLHVYKVPPELWRDSFNNILNNVVTETVSIGIIRVPAELALADIRDEISQQLGVHASQMLPKDYVFLRSVGRSLTTLRRKQEHELKAKHFVPPVAYSPELYILEATPEVREALVTSDTSSQSPPLSRQTSPSHRSYPSIHQNGYNGNVSHESPRKAYTQHHLLTSPGCTHRSFPENNGNLDTFRKIFSHSSHNLQPCNSSKKVRSQNRNIKYQNENSEWYEQLCHSHVTGFRPASDHTLFLSKTCLPSSIDGGRDRPHGDDMGGFSSDDDYNRHNKDSNTNVHRKNKGSHKHGSRYSSDTETDGDGLRRGDFSENRNSENRRWRRNDQDGSGEDEEHNGRNVENTQHQLRYQKNQLLEELEETKQARQNQEREREGLLKKAKHIQHKTIDRRNEARDMWKKKYFEEKKRTGPLEDHTNRLHNELEALHRRRMNILEGPKDKNMKVIDTGPSEKSNYVIQCAKLQYDIEDLQQRVENAKMKLTAEMKLRVQAQSEMKAARNRAMQNRLSLRMARAH